MVPFILAGAAAVFEVVGTVALVLDARAGGSSTAMLILLLVGLPVGHILLRRRLGRPRAVALRLLTAAIAARQRMADRQIARIFPEGALTGELRDPPAGE